jgi:hypothetical protein
MVIAALVSFAILLVAWIVAPDHPRTETPKVEAPMTEPQPAAI